MLLLISAPLSRALIPSFSARNLLQFHSFWCFQAPRLLAKLCLMKSEASLPTDPFPAECRSLMSSFDDEFAEPPKMMEDSETVGVDPDVTLIPLEASAGDKRKRRSRVWQHFTMVENGPGGREECRCNHCGQVYACSSRHGTGHLNRHILERCQKYKPTPDELQTPHAHTKDDFHDVLSVACMNADRADGRNESTAKKNFGWMEAQLARLKDENAKLQQEKDAVMTQKESLEQLLVTMASEMARLTEENTKLKEDCAELQEEKQKIVTREEFTRLEAQVTKLREDFEKDRRRFPASIVASLAQIHKNK